MLGIFKGLFESKEEKQQAVYKQLAVFADALAQIAQATVALHLKKTFQEQAVIRANRQACRACGECMARHQLQGCTVPNTSPPICSGLAWRVFG